MFTLFPTTQLSKQELMDIIRAVNKTCLPDDMKDDLKHEALDLWKKGRELEAVCKRFYIPT